MHRVELKEHHALTPTANLHTKFLMHRVELKAHLILAQTRLIFVFLMHRVELKASNFA